MDENTSQGMKGDSGSTGCCTKTRSKQPILKNESIIVKIRHVIHRRQTDKPVLKLQFQFDKLNGTSLHKVKGSFPLDLQQQLVLVYNNLCCL